MCFLLGIPYTNSTDLTEAFKTHGVWKSFSDKVNIHIKYSGLERITSFSNWSEWKNGLNTKARLRTFQWLHIIFERELIQMGHGGIEILNMLYRYNAALTKLMSFRVSMKQLLEFGEEYQIVARSWATLFGI